MVSEAVDPTVAYEAAINRLRQTTETLVLTEAALEQTRKRLKELEAEPDPVD